MNIVAPVVTFQNTIFQITVDQCNVRHTAVPPWRDGTGEGVLCGNC